MPSCKSLFFIDRTRFASKVHSRTFTILIARAQWKWLEFQIAEVDAGYTAAVDFRETEKRVETDSPRDTRKENAALGRGDTER